MSSHVPDPVAELLPNLIPEGEFIDRTYAALGAWGFSNNSALAMVGVCRDELCTTLPAHVERAWGAPFVLTGLGGYLTAGTTGFGAGHAHAPEPKDMRSKEEKAKLKKKAKDKKVPPLPRRYVYVNMPHLGVLDDGTLGKAGRPGQRNASGACGALCALQADAQSPDGINTEFNPADAEYSLLKAALAKKVKADTGLLDITLAARKAIAAQVRKAALDNSHYALITGVQVHLSSGQYIYDGTCQVRMAGGGLRKVKF